MDEDSVGLSAALDLANARLLEQLRERARIEEQLLDTRKMEAIGRLAGGIAHDFNNLLTVITLQLSALRRGLADRPQARVRVDEIELAIAFATSLTSKLVAFSRREPVRGEPIDPADALAAMEPLLRRLCGQAITVRTKIERDAGCVEMDRIGLEQVLLNLVINARDAMPDGGEVTISVERIGRDGRELVAIAVRDTGIGMDAGTRERLFEPFFTTRETEGGTGLGLATTYSSVVQAGGFVDVTSEPGEGSEFVVCLPRVAETTAKPDRPPLVPDIASKTVLVVDDEDDLREWTGFFLQRAGYRVLEASSGAAALDLVARHAGTIDLLLIDVAMPRMTGFTLSTRLQEMIPGVATVFMSGYLVTRPNAGARYLQKPFTCETLLLEVGAALEAGGMLQRGQ